MASTSVSRESREPLTERQLEVLNFIRSSIIKNGYPPTLREIGEFLGIKSTNGVNDHLKALEKKGYLAREDLKSRALRPLDAPGALPDNVTPIRPNVGLGAKTPLELSGDMVEIPLLGRVAAGAPLLAVENVEDSVRVDRFFIGNQREVFALRVKGESMIEDGIHDGDFIFVKKQMNAARGDIVVAMIEDEATVKRYFPEGDNIRLQPANSRMKPIIVSKRDFKSVNIIGVVVGLYRKV